MKPELLATLQKELQTKSVRLNEIVANESATADQIREGNTLHAECLKIKNDIQASRENASARDRLKLGAKALTEWQNEPAGGQPIGGPALEVKGTEAAGHRTLERQRDGSWQAIEEVGAGTFGRKTWDLIDSLEYKAAFTAYLRHGDRARDLVKFKALNEAADDQGGVLAPAEMIAKIIGREPAPTRIRSRVTTVTTGRDMLEATRLQYAADDLYTTGIRVTSTGETPASDDAHAVDDSKLFGTVQIPIHTYMLSAAITRNMLEDSSYPIQSWLEGKFGETTDLLYDNQILNGNGQGNPFGILFGALAGAPGTDPMLPEVILSGAAGQITADMLEDMQTALAEQYENENTCWIMNKKSALRAIRKLKDSQNRPLFTTGSQDYGIVGARGRVLLGDPIAVSGFMPNVGAANFPVIYGDPKGYYVGQRLGLSIQVLDQTQAKKNRIEIVGRLRFGGKVVEPWRLKIGKSNNA